MEYRVIVKSSGQELTREVTQLINEGWTPVGSHQVVVTHQQNRFSGTQHKDTIIETEYSQTMIKN